MPDSCDDARSAALIADDDDEIRRFLQHVLATSFTVNTSTSGAGALEQSAERTYDIVILELMLRDRITGITVVERLRTRIEDRGVEIVAMTGYAHVADPHNLLERGFDAFLKKPFSIEEVREVLD